MNIPFNKPYLTGKEAHYIYQAVYSGKISGNGTYTKKCQKAFEQKHAIKKALLTTSCTDALEMSAILLNISPGDEVIAPSFTFVSTALAFIRQGAYIRFADSESDTPNINAGTIEPLINKNTKAIVVVHYAGMSCDMDKIMAIANKHNIAVVEDAAQAVDSYYKGRPLGSIGHLSTFSFHETKNLSSGEGGLLGINDEQYIDRAEIIWEKGTNRSQFFRGEVNKYGWVDTGSSFLPSDVIAAFLYAQLENIDYIQKKRCDIWEHYYAELKENEQKGNFKLPSIPAYATNNAHMFYILCNSIEERTALIDHLKSKGVLAVFHYLSLHKSEYYKDKHDGRELPMSDYYEDCLLRLPMYYELSIEEQDYIIEGIKDFFQK